MHDYKIVAIVGWILVVLLFIAWGLAMRGWSDALDGWREALDGWKLAIALSDKVDELPGKE